MAVGSLLPILSEGIPSTRSTHPSQGPTGIGGQRLGTRPVRLARILRKISTECAGQSALLFETILPVLTFDFMLQDIATRPISNPNDDLQHAYSSSDLACF